LLQVLDDGRLTDNKGRVANFKNTIIIMTTNIGSHLIQENFEKITEVNRASIMSETKDQVFDLLKKSVRPEFLNRVDELIMFHPLTTKDLRKIVSIQFNIIQSRLEDNGVKIEISDRALDQLAQWGYDPQFGARPLKRVMQREILNELSKEILSGKVQKDSIVGIDLDEEGKINFMNLDNVEIE
jgi:ATP-dependent Clp protease ATP-binding subunit ClpB